MAVKLERELKGLHPSQLLYLACNCNPSQLKAILKSDYDIESIPYQKFGKLTSHNLKWGLTLNKSFQSVNYDCTYLNKITPTSSPIMEHSGTLDISNYENVVAVWNDNSNNTNGTIYSGMAEDGEHLWLALDLNGLLADFTFYGKDEHGNFVMIGAPSWERYGKPTTPVSGTGRQISPLGDWDNPYTTDYVNERMRPRWINDNIEISDATPYVSFRIAKDLYGARKYAIDGDEGGLIDDGTEPTDREKDLKEKLYFKMEYWRGVVDDTRDVNSYYCNGYYEDGFFKEAEMDADFYALYEFNLRDKPNLCMYVGAQATPSGTHADDYYNAKMNLYLLEREGAKYYEDEQFPVFCWNMGEGGRYKNVSSAIGDGLTPIGLRPNSITSIGDIDGMPYYLFGANLETNIPIFASRELAEKYLAGEITTAEAINDVGFKISDGINQTGSILTGHKYNDVDASAVSSECLCCSYSAYSEFFDKLFDVTNQEGILEGLKLYGTNPTDFIVDTFVVPFEASTFQELVGTNELTFGTYHVGTTATFQKTSKLNPKIVKAFSCEIRGGFNDWRDYASEYYLSLPYVGRNIHINKEKYLYKQLDCDVCVDVRTGAIKYYLKCNGIITDTYEGICRISTPIQTSNNYAYAREKIGACASFIGNVASAGISFATANPLGVAGGVAGAVDSVFDMEKVKKIETTGNCSSALAWCDPLECYLIVQTPEFVYPTNIASAYGLPSNVIGKIGSYSGYIEVKDIQLNVPCTETERNEIESALASGIII